MNKRVNPYPEHLWPKGVRQHKTIVRAWMPYSDEGTRAVRLHGLGRYVSRETADDLLVGIAQNLTREAVYSTPDGIQVRVTPSGFHASHHLSLEGEDYEGILVARERLIREEVMSRLEEMTQRQPDFRDASRRPYWQLETRGDLVIAYGLAIPSSALPIRREAMSNP